MDVRETYWNQKENTYKDHGLNDKKKKFVTKN